MTKYLLTGFALFGVLGGAAFAADMPVKAPVAPVAAPYNWTGFYVGANVGGGWGNPHVDFSPNDPFTLFFFDSASGRPPATSFRTTGAVGGLQLGYNYQFNRNFLLGLETDFDWSGIEGSSSNAVVFHPAPVVSVPLTQKVDAKIKWFGTVRARLGYLPTQNLLAYVTGGFAYARVEQTGIYADNDGLSGFGGFGFSFLCLGGGSACFAGSTSNVATGWTVGGGLEYAFWQHWSLKGEYLHISVEGKSLTETTLLVSPGTLPASFNANYSRTNFDVARVGLNYRF